jgi:hypothetical protein
MDIENKLEQQQQRACEHLQDLLDLEEGLTGSELKWVERFGQKMKKGHWFTPRELEIIYDIYSRRF